MRQLTIETEREEDGRWVAEVPQLPGVMVYGSTREQATAGVEALALRTLAENIEENGRPAEAIEIRLRQDLEEALEDLRTTPDEAVDEGFPQPTKLALANARRILRPMYALLPTRLEVYPTPDGEVAIVAPGAARHSVMVLCESNGGALCMVNMDGEHRRARYSTADSLPDGFLRDALNELAHRTADALEEPSAGSASGTSA